MSTQRIAVCGLGQMGSWIAAKAARARPPVTVYDADDATLRAFLDTLGDAPPSSVVPADSVASAVRDADVVIETITEDAAEKNKFYRDAGAALGADAIVASNTSILAPESFLGGFERLNRFCCFHFYRPDSIVEIMPLSDTDAGVVETLASLAEAMGEQPIVLQKPYPGYIVSAMAGAATDVALHLAASGVADPRSIDAAWKSVTQMPHGPFEMLDMIGLDTSLRIRERRLQDAPDDERLRAGAELLRQYTEAGKMGAKSGAGFYDY